MAPVRYDNCYLKLYSVFLAGETFGQIFLSLLKLFFRIAYAIKVLADFWENMYTIH